MSTRKTLETAFGVPAWMASADIIFIEPGGRMSIADLLAGQPEVPPDYVRELPGWCWIWTASMSGLEAADGLSIGEYHEASARNEVQRLLSFAKDATPMLQAVALRKQVAAMESARAAMEINRTPPELRTPDWDQQSDDAMDEAEVNGRMAAIIRRVFMLYTAERGRP